MGWVEGSEAIDCPVGDGEYGSCYAEGGQDGSGGEAGFECDVEEEAVEARVFGEESFGDGEDLGEEREGDRLKAQKHGYESVEERVDVESDAV